MATISAPDLVLLRTKPQRSSIYLSVLQPATLLTAQVNNGSIARGARTIAYDNGTGSGFATIATGQTLEVDTATGIKKTAIASISGSQASGTITVYENGIAWADNLAIRIKHNYEPHPVPPAIRSGIFYKRYNTAYTDQNSKPNPVAIAGSHRAGFLTSGSIVFSLAAGNSYAMAQGATISTYAWSCVLNGGGTTGITIASASSASTTITFTVAGQYWLKLIVTDSNGKQMTTYRAIFVHNRTGSNLPYTGFDLQSLTGDWQSGGWKTSLSVNGAATLSDFPDHTLAVLWHENYIDGSEDYVNLWGVSDNVLMAGYIRQDTNNDRLESGTGTVSFNLTTIDDLLNNLTELGSISLNAVSSPQKWYQYASWMTAGRSIHHLILWHSWGILYACDVYGLNTNTLKVKNTDYTEAPLLQQANDFAMNRGIFAKLICDRLGRMHLVEDSQMLNTSGRAALDTVFTLTTADISGTVDVVRSPEESISFTELSGFAFDGTTSTPYISIMPGYRESSISYIMPEFRGSGSARTGNQILASQTDSNEKTGRVHAAANNNPRELRFSTPGNYIGAFDIIPSIGFYIWNIANASLKRQTELNGRKFICRNVSHSVSIESGLIQTSVVLEPEAIGPDGIVGNYPTSYPVISHNPTEPSWDSNPPIATAIYSILIYRDTSDDKGYARLVTNSTLSLGSEVEIASVAEDFYGGMLAVLSSSTALVVWTSAGGNVVCKVLTLSGGTISAVGSLQTLLQIDTTNTLFFSVRALSATQAIMVYQYTVDGLPYSAQSVILDISGDTVTNGTPVVIDSNEQPRQISIGRLSATSAIATWQDNATSDGTGVKLSISGSTITAETPIDFDPTVGTVGMEVLTSLAAIVFYADSPSFNPTARSLYGLDGTGFSVGGENVLDGTATIDETYAGHRFNTKITSDKVVVAWKDTTGTNQALACIRNDGAGALAGGTPLIIYSDEGAYFPQISAVASDKVIIVYREGAPDNFGVILTVTINADLSITNDGNSADISANVINYLDIEAVRNIV